MPSSTTNGNRRNGKAAVHNVVKSRRRSSATEQARRADLPGTRRLAVCPDCKILYPVCDGACPDCSEKQSEGREEGHARISSKGSVKSPVKPKSERRRSFTSITEIRPRPAKNGKTSARRAPKEAAGGPLKEVIIQLQSKAPTGNLQIVTISAVAALALVGGYFLLINDPEAVVARKALDATRPATAATLASSRQAEDLADLSTTGDKAQKAQKAITAGTASAGGLEDRTYKTVVSRDLNAQRNLISPYAALAAIKPRRIGSAGLRTLSRNISTSRPLATQEVVGAQRAVDDVGSLAPDGRRPVVSRVAIAASAAQAAEVLDQAARKIGAWERRVDAWRRQHAQKQAALRDYEAQTRSAMNDYQAMRRELDELDRNELDSLPMYEAQSRLQDHRDRRLDVLDRLMAVQPPAWIAGSHDRLEETVREGADGLDNAINAMDDQGDLAVGTDYWGDTVLFGKYFRDQEAWHSYEDTSERNSAAIAQEIPAWEAAVAAEHKRLDGRRPPARPRV